MNSTFHYLFCIGFSAGLSLLPAHAQRPGDEWNTTRGDETPGLRYSIATATKSGRLIGVTAGGGLSISDDGGTNWRFDRIEIDGVPVRGTFTSIYQVPDGPLIAVMVRLEEASEGFFRYQARSYFVSSSDNGNTWSISAFPKTFATFRGSGRRWHGVNITGLHMGPGGQLIAYGTISGSSGGPVLWSIGGVIFRQAGATWEQAFYGYGPIDKVTNANGRAVAAAFSGILDSADGAGWNGYQMSDIQVTVDGAPMDAKTRNRLRIIDVEVLDGTYIAQGATFIPFSENIDTTFFDKVFKMSSPTPFSGARNWTAFNEPYHGPFTKVGTNIISAGPGGAYYTSGGGAGFALGGADVRARGRAIAVSGGSTAVAVQSSETVWKSTNGGAAWSKVWDKEVGPDLFLIGTYDGVIFARANNRELWTSRDNGDSWQQSLPDYPGGIAFQKGADGRLISTGSGGNVVVSDDGGITWESRMAAENGRGGFLLQRSQTGRLIMPVRGWDVRNEGKFYVSDDNGETWAPKNAGVAFGEEVRAIAQAKSGRLLVPTNTFALFDPEISISDDDGETWRTSEVLKSLEGLDTVTGDPSTKVIEIKKLKVSTTGRVIAMSETVILYSDDEGETWTVGDNFDFNGTGPLDALELRDITQAGRRWIAVGHYRTPFPQSRYKHFIALSDDDGATWGLRPFETRQPNTFLYHLAVTDNDRVIIAGDNASIFVSDFDTFRDPGNPSLTIREGSFEQIAIDRPDVDGVIEASYNTVPRTAEIGTDFYSSNGMLRWEADDIGAKSITLETVDNDTRDGERTFILQLEFETSEALAGKIETEVAIEDNDSGIASGIVFEGADTLYTSETGTVATLGVALERQPSAEVRLTISGVDSTEGQISTESLTFTPANWGIAQKITITGVDDPDADGDASYSLVFTPTSDDSSYADLSATTIAVVNTGDEPLPSFSSGGYADWIAENNVPQNASGPMDDPNGDDIPNVIAYALGLSPLGPPQALPIVINRDRVLAFSVPEDVTGVRIGSELSDQLNSGSWVPGPPPVAGAPVNGRVPYTLQIPEDDRTSFARLTFELEI